MRTWRTHVAPWGLGDAVLFRGRPARGIRKPSPIVGAPP